MVIEIELTAEKFYRLKTIYEKCDKIASADEEYFARQKNFWPETITHDEKRYLYLLPKVINLLERLENIFEVLNVSVNVSGCPPLINKIVMDVSDYNMLISYYKRYANNEYYLESVAKRGC